jgi:hypothetical protein
LAQISNLHAMVDQAFGYSTIIKSMTVLFVKYPGTPTIAA